MRYNKDNIDHILKEIGDLLMPLWNVTGIKFWVITNPGGSAFMAGMKVNPVSLVCWNSIRSHW